MKSHVHDPHAGEQAIQQFQRQHMLRRLFADARDLVLDIFGDPAVEHQHHGGAHQMFDVIKGETRRIARQTGQLHAIADFLGVLVVLVDQFGEAGEQAVGVMPFALTDDLGVDVQALLHPRRAPTGRADDEHDVFFHEPAQPLVRLNVGF